MVLKAYNTTGSSKSYLSGTITISANNFVTVAIEKQYDLAQDGSFRHDCVIGEVYLNDGNVNLNYGSSDALDYLDKILSQNVTLIGATNGTRIGNVGDRLKVETQTSFGEGGKPFSWTQLRYVDMNASNGGVARGATITEANNWVDVFSYNGSGFLTGFAMTMGTANTGWLIRLVIDGTEEIFSSGGILTTDVNGIYGMTVGTQNIATQGLGMAIDASRFYYTAPAYYPIKYATSLSIKVKRAAGSGSKAFSGGLIGLTKET